MIHLHKIYYSSLEFYETAKKLGDGKLVDPLTLPFVWAKLMEKIKLRRCNMYNVRAAGAAAARIRQQIRQEQMKRKQMRQELMKQKQRKK